MKTLLILLSLFLGGKIVAQEQQKVRLHDFPGIEKIEITYTTTNKQSIDTLAKETLFILLDNPTMTNTPDLLIAELNKRMYALKVSNLIYK